MTSSSNNINASEKDLGVGASLLAAVTNNDNQAVNVLGTATKQRRISIEPMHNDDANAILQHQQQQQTNHAVPQHVEVDCNSSISSVATTTTNKMDNSSLPMIRVPRQNDNMVNNDDHNNKDHRRRISNLKPSAEASHAIHSNNDVSVVAAVGNMDDDAVIDFSHHDEHLEEDDHSVLSTTSSTADSDVDMDDANNSSSPPPTTEALKYQCWKCHVPF